MKITEEKLKNDLIEMYTYYFKRSVEESEGRDLLSEVTPEQAWNIGKCDGAVEALGAVMLQVFGGQMMFEIWQKTMKSAQPEKTQLSGESTTKDSTFDCISRQAAIDAQEAYMGDHPLDGYEDELALIDILRNLPSGRIRMDTIAP